MKRLFVFTFLIALIGIGTGTASASSKAKKASTVYLKPSNVELKWIGKKVTGQHNGTIQLKSGSLKYVGQIPASGVFVIDMKSIKDVDQQDKATNEKLIGHLSSDDFFAVEKYPTATFKFYSVQKLTGNQYLFKGKLTIKDVTKDYSVKATVSNNNTIAKGQLQIDRTAFNIRYGSGKFFSSLGDKVINDIFTVDFKVALK